MPKVIAVAETPNESLDHRGSRLPANAVTARNEIMDYWREAASSNLHWRKMVRHFDQLFGYLGGKEQVYFTNILKCSKGTRTEMAPLSEIEDAVGRCRTYLQEEFGSIRPQVLVTFSKAALDGVLHAVGETAYVEFYSNEASFSKAVGRAVRVRGLDSHLLPLFHWSWWEVHARRFSKPDYLDNAKKILRRLTS